MRVLLCVLAFSVGLGAGRAAAGECPPDQRGQNAPARITAAAGIAEEALVAFDLAEHYGVNGRVLRLRRLVVAPGGVIPWHGHAERPGAATILSGEMTEYSSTCRIPVVYRAGESVAENGPFFHQWRNEGNEPAVILTTDLPPAPQRR